MSQPAKIVLAEDDIHILDLLHHVLTAQGYEVISAKDGEEALEAVRKTKPDLLITDVMMPRRNGYQLVHAILNESQDLHAPKIIMLTSRTDPADIKKGLTVGADIYIAKPFDIQDVSAHIKDLLTRK